MNEKKKIDAHKLLYYKYRCCTGAWKVATKKKKWGAGLRTACTWLHWSATQKKKLGTTGISRTDRRIFHYISRLTLKSGKVVIFSWPDVWSRSLILSLWIVSFVQIIEFSGHWIECIWTVLESADVFEDVSPLIQAQVNFQHLSSFPSQSPVWMDYHFSDSKHLSYLSFVWYMLGVRWLHFPHNRVLLNCSIGKEGRVSSQISRRISDTFLSV